MTTFELAQFLVQIITALALLLTLYVYYRQLRTMAGQLEASRSANSAQNILSLVTFLQAPDVRMSREVMRIKLAKKSFDRWTDDERSDASRVCSTYDVAAILVRLGLVPIRPIVETWGHSIRHCYEVATPLILEMQRPENSGSTYWDDFGWLNEQVINAGIAKADA